VHAAAIAVLTDVINILLQAEHAIPYQMTLDETLPKPLPLINFFGPWLFEACHLNGYGGLSLSLSHTLARPAAVLLHTNSKRTLSPALPHSQHAHSRQGGCNRCLVLARRAPPWRPAADRLAVPLLRDHLPVSAGPLELDRVVLDSHQVEQHLQPRAAGLQHSHSALHERDQESGRLSLSQTARRHPRHLYAFSSSHLRRYSSTKRPSHLRPRTCAPRAS